MAKDLLKQLPARPNTRIGDIEERRSAQELQIQKWFALAALAWFACGIVAVTVVTGTAIYFWVEGSLSDLPAAIKWLLGILTGVQGIGFFWVQRAVSYYFPKAPRRQGRGRRAG